MLFEQGRYLEFGARLASSDVAGVGGVLSPGESTGNIAETFGTVSFAFKDDIYDTLSYAIVYDQPFGADVTYPASTHFASGTSAELNTYSLTDVLQYNFQKNFSVFGGLRAEALDASAAVPFVGAPLGYTIETNRDFGIGYLVGAAFEKPELALRVALTYNSGVDHDLNTAEVLNGVASNTVTAIDTPQSVNLEFQSGINAKALAFGSVRWVEWSEFEISPPAFSAETGGPLAFYADDRVTINLGLGRRINEIWSVFGSVGYERSTDSLTGNLTPTDGYTSLTVGASYSKGNMKITGAVSYRDIGDANSTAGGAAPASVFADSSAIGAGVKVGFSF